MRIKCSRAPRAASKMKCRPFRTSRGRMSARARRSPTSSKGRSGTCTQQQGKESTQDKTKKTGKHRSTTQTRTKHAHATWRHTRWQRHAERGTRGREDKREQSYLGHAPAATPVPPHTWPFAKRKGAPTEPPRGEALPRRHCCFPPLSFFLVCFVLFCFWWCSTSMSACGVLFLSPNTTKNGLL